MRPWYRLFDGYLLALCLVLAGVLAILYGCGPGMAPGRLGFTAARAPTYGSVTVAEQPDTSGEGVNSGFNYWNIAAGRQLFSRSDSAPQVTFSTKTPLIAYEGTPQQRRVVAYAGLELNPDGSMKHCTVVYDPTFIAQQVPGRTLNARTWAHEIGHCLDLEAHEDCARNQGVMSNCDFWDRVLSWWGPTLADYAELKNAGYVP